MYKSANVVKTGYGPVSILKKLIAKLFQKPDIYPIRYYKSSRRLSNGYNRYSGK